MQTTATGTNTPITITKMGGVLSVSVSGVVVEFTLYITFVKVVVVLLDGKAVVVFDKTMDISSVFVFKFMMSDTVSSMFRVESVVSILVVPIILTGMVTLVCTFVDAVCTAVRRRIGSVINKIDTLEYVVEKAVATSVTYSS